MSPCPSIQYQSLVFTTKTQRCNLKCESPQVAIWGITALLECGGPSPLAKLSSRLCVLAVNAAKIRRLKTNSGGINSGLAQAKSSLDRRSLLHRLASARCLGPTRRPGSGDRRSQQRKAGEYPPSSQ